ncbi:kinesin-like protein [Umbelopsis sp. WA50703]
MNFGPEWMRGTLPKRVNNLESSRSNSPTAPISGSATKSASSHHPAIQRQHSILDGLTVLDQNSVIGPSSTYIGQDDQQDNPYKYSKEFMLNLFKPYALPVEIERHEYVVVEECQQPLAKVELTEHEKKLLSGPAHSNLSRKRADNVADTNADGRSLRNKGEFAPSPTSEKDANSTRFGLNRAKGQPSDNVASASLTGEPQDIDPASLRSSQPLAQGLNQSDDRYQNHANSSNWSQLSSSHDAHFDESSVLSVLDEGKGGSNGVFDQPSSMLKSTAHLNDRFNSMSLGNSSFSSSIGVDMGSKVDSPHAFASSTPLNDSRKAPEQYQWYYRDPTGLVQGPFEAQDMHDWYKAGFFSQTLLIRREDEISFEPLAALIRKIGDEDKPFLVPYSPQSQSSVRTPLDFGMQQQSRMLEDPFLRSPFGIGGQFGSQPPLPHQSDMLLQQQLSASHLGGLGGLGGNFFQQRPTSAQSPSSLLGSYGNFGSNLFGTPRESGMGSPWGEVPQQVNATRGSAIGGTDLFGGNNLNPLLSPHRQTPTQQLNPMFTDPAGQAGFLDHSQRSLSQQQMQHQQYMQMLQQKQMFQQQQAEAMNASMHHLHQQQQQQQQLQQQQSQSPTQQEQNDSTTSLSTPATTASIAPAAEKKAKKSSGFNGWGSAPGTPLFGGASWEPLVSTPSRTLAEDPFEKRSAVQSPAISPLKRNRTLDISKTDAVDQQRRQVEELLTETADVNIASSLLKSETEIADQKADPEVASPPPRLPSVITAPVVKPISLREIQEEELKKQKEVAKQQHFSAKAPAKPTGWGSSTPWSLSDEAPKGLSLREIQELEAKEFESRKNLEKQSAADMLDQSSPQFSTPSTMSWGVVSPIKHRPATPSGTSNAAPWASTTAPKKTLREIQMEEEEEARKAKAAQQQAASLASAVSQAANTSHGSAANSSGKGYAGIVGNTGIRSHTPTSSWTTVTSSRTTKAPTSSTSSSTRSPWDTVGAPKQQASAVNNTSASSTATLKAATGDKKGPSEDFYRWCRQALKGLDSNVDSEDFMQMLVAFPLDNSSVEIIQDMIYANSTSLDGRRFADEFMKRRKADLAGKLDISNVVASDDDTNAFKVVSKKKRFVKA